MNRPMMNDAAAVEEHVRRRVWGQVSDLRLEDREGAILLRGHAPTYYVKQLAQHAVLESGRRLAANEIDVVLVN